MPRPRKYEGDAKEAHKEAARAYRETQAARFVRVERAAMDELQAAIEAAAASGDLEAENCRRSSGSSLLRNLALVFRRRTEGRG